MPSTPSACLSAATTTTVRASCSIFSSRRLDRGEIDAELAHQLAAADGDPAAIDDASDAAPDLRLHALRRRQRDA
ncbi:MAG: hypothetical protein ACXWVR_06110 [Rhodoplanes sp.]